MTTHGSKIVALAALVAAGLMTQKQAEVTKDYIDNMPKDGNFTGGITFAPQGKIRSLIYVGPRIVGQDQELRNLLGGKDVVDVSSVRDFSKLHQYNTLTAECFEAYRDLVTAPAAPAKKAGGKKVTATAKS